MNNNNVMAEPVVLTVEETEQTRKAKKQPGPLYSARLLSITTSASTGMSLQHSQWFSSRQTTRRQAC